MYKAALVLEGGAMRGQYTAGVLDAFMKDGTMFDTVIGVSAGALCGVNYISQQIGRTNDINVNYRHDSNYIAARRVLRRQDIINLDYLFGHHGNGWRDFDAETYNNSPMNFVVVATAIETGRAVYFDRPVGAQMKGILKASSSMPFLSVPKRTSQGLCLDGGIADSIPYVYAQLLGYDKIVVIRTRNREYRKSPTSPLLRRAYERAYAAHPQFVVAAVGRPEMYNHQAEQLQKLERMNRVFTIAPAEPVTVGRIEGNTEKLAALHDLGEKDGQDSLHAMRIYLEN